MVSIIHRRDSSRRDFRSANFVEFVPPTWAGTALRDNSTVPIAAVTHSGYRLSPFEKCLFPEHCV